MLALIENVDCSFRFHGMAAILQSLCRSWQGLRVLDVGGLGSFAQAVPGASVTSVNPEPLGRAGIVAGDGRHLPFADQSFDVVVMSEVLEHAYAYDRTQMLQEGARVARDVLLVSGPWETPEAVRAEKRIDEIHLMVTGSPEIWLQEHRYYGRPAPEIFVLPRGYLTTETYELTPVQLNEFGTIIDIVCLAMGRTDYVSAARDALLGSFGPLELNGPSYRKVWVARRSKPLPPRGAVNTHPLDFTDRLVAVMPAIVNAIAQATSELKVRSTRLSLEALAVIPSTEAYRNSHARHADELEVEVQRLRTQEREREVQRLPTLRHRTAQLIAEQEQLRAALRLSLATHA